MRGQPLLHAALEQRLLAELQVLLRQRDADGAEHLRDRVVVLVHAILEDLRNRREAEHAKGALEAGGRLAGGRLDPLLLLGVEVCVFWKEREGGEVRGQKRGWGRVIIKKGG